MNYMIEIGCMLLLSPQGFVRVDSIMSGIYVFTEKKIETEYRTAVSPILTRRCRQNVHHAFLYILILNP